MGEGGGMVDDLSSGWFAVDAVLVCATTLLWLPHVHSVLACAIA